MSGLLSFWRRHFLFVEGVIGTLPCIVLITWFLVLDGTSYTNDLLGGNRANIYRTTAAIAGTLLGFSMAGVAMVLNFVPSKRLTILQNSPHYPDLWKTFFQAAKFLGLLTITALVCLVFDKDTDPCAWFIVPFCLFLSLSALRVLRVVWILEQIIGLVSAPSPADRRS